MVQDWQVEFDAFAARKTRQARDAGIPGFRTTMLGDHSTLMPIGDAWSCEAFDGPFYAHRPGPMVPSVSLVMVQSASGNTVAGDPAALGGGSTDKHLIYEGLSRVAADGVLAGARTVDTRTVFSVWHPQLVGLREHLRKPRHPAQLIVTGRGDLDVEQLLIMNCPAISVFVLTTSEGVRRVRPSTRDRSWVHVIDCGDVLNFRAAFHRLQSDFGVRVISAVGGRTTASSLLRQRLVSDLYLTSSPVRGGEPGTPLQVPGSIPKRLVVAKAGRGQEEGVRFEDWALGA